MDTNHDGARRLAVLLVALLLPAAAPAQERRTQACEVRPGCVLYTQRMDRCEAVLDWSGSCTAGLVHGKGATFHADGTAHYGWFEKGRLTGSFVWHQNGLITRIGEYQTQVVTLDASGNSDGTLAVCSWDEWDEQLVARDASYRVCQRVAGVLGLQAFSSSLWRQVARTLSARTAPQPPSVRSKSTSRRDKVLSRM
jgi:hypothetical protein